ncbi:MAG: sigma-54-dependent Fis family transcriptional regulator [Deltaproteobacteria bacterium]|nr:sigma-54-dependent Fis family transcriptional regulator [Deltaproteobacteria bacterium]
MKVLILDDEEGMRHMLGIILTKEGFEVKACSDASSALKSIDKEDFDFILSDIKMPGMDGLEFLSKIRSNGNDATVIMMSAYGTMDMALECMKRGAYDYISKPFKADEIILTLKKATEREKLKKENERLKRESFKEHDISGIYSKNEVMLKAIEMARKVSGYDTSVLITGETGTGKELIARTIHFDNGGSRSKGPFVAVNCAAIPANLIESELFGHVRGAFTDAVMSRDGLFMEADGGTIFLDEVGELPIELQTKLLRVLQEGEIRRVGESTSRRVDVRVVSATVRNLEQDIKQGRFRNDLFYRLNVVPIHLPPIRDRKDDIEGLVMIFLERYALKYSKSINSVADKAMKMLKEYSWPGNVRELENIVERAVILEDSEELQPDNLPVSKGEGSMAVLDGVFKSDNLSIKRAEEILERELIKRALDRTKGNRTKAAELLEISHRTLLYKIKSFEL